MLSTLATGSTLNDHHLTLKISYLVMQFGDIGSFTGYINGSSYIIKAIDCELLMLRSLEADITGKRFASPIMSCGSGDSDFLFPVLSKL